MFINCPFCKALVATDPATDLPPEHCPRCAAKLRGVPLEASAPTASSTVPHEDAGTRPAPVFDLLEVPAPDAPADTGASAPVASELAARIHHAVATEPAPDPIAPIATLLKRPAPAQEPRPESGPEPGAGPAAAQPQAEAAPARGAGSGPMPAGTPGSAPDPAAAPAIAPPTPEDLDRTQAGTPEGAESAAPPAPAREAAPPAAGDDAASGADAAPAPVVPQPTAKRVSAATAAPAIAQPAAKALPSFARTRRRLASGFDWTSGAAVAGLALLLLLQLLLADRAHLAGDARWRPLLANACGVLGCALPPWREPDAFTVLARDVRPHPSTPGTLHVTATFRNDARWAQPWPRIRLTLSDVNGSAVAARDFDVRDYLGDAPTQDELRSGQSASIAMDVVEPAARSVAFDFELH